MKGSQVGHFLFISFQFFFNLNTHRKSMSKSKRYTKLKTFLFFFIRSQFKPIFFRSLLLLLLKGNICFFFFSINGANILNKFQHKLKKRKYSRKTHIKSPTHVYVIVNLSNNSENGLTISLDPYIRSEW